MKEADEPTRRGDSRRTDSVSSRREEDEPTRRVDSIRTESVSSRREGEEPTRRAISITFMTQKGTLYWRTYNELIRKQGEHISGQHVSGEGKHDTRAIIAAIQDIKRESGFYIFSGQKTDGAEQDVTMTAEEERADLPFWDHFGLDSLKALLPGSLQELLCEQAIPVVITLGLLQTSPKKGSCLMLSQDFSFDINEKEMFSL